MIELVSLQQAGELDAYVTHHPRGHYMQTSLWGFARPDRRWQGIILRTDGVIRATMALHITDGAWGIPYYYAPRGPVFDTLADFRALILAAQDVIRSQGGYQLRIDPPISALDAQFQQCASELSFQWDLASGFSAFQPQFVYQTDLTGSTQESLLARFRSKTRYNIRLAQRRGVTVSQGGLADVEVFHQMMVETAERDGFPCRSEAFFQRILLGMGSHGRLLLARKDGLPLAGAIQITLGKKSWYAYGCSFACGREDMPNFLLQWEMMRYALEQGCRLYDFRGVEGPGEPGSPGWGLHRFKQGFDATLVEYTGQLDLTVSPWKAAAIRQFQRIKGHLFH